MFGTQSSSSATAAFGTPGFGTSLFSTPFSQQSHPQHQQTPSIFQTPQLHQQLQTPSIFLTPQQQQTSSTPFGLKTPFNTAAQSQITPNNASPAFQFSNSQLTTQMAPVAPIPFSLPDRDIQVIVDAYKEENGNPMYAFKHLLYSVTDLQHRIKPAGISDILWADAMGKLEGLESSHRERLWPQLVQGFKDLANRLKNLTKALAAMAESQTRMEANQTKLEQWIYNTTGYQRGGEVQGEQPSEEEETRGSNRDSKLSGEGELRHALKLKGVEESLNSPAKGPCEELRLAMRGIEIPAFDGTDHCEITKMNRLVVGSVMKRRANGAGVSCYSVAGTPFDVFGAAKGQSLGLAPLEEGPPLLHLGRNKDVSGPANKSTQAPQSTQAMVYWPLDACWYSGHVLGYNLEAGRQKYEDDEEENLILVNERVKFYVSHEEMDSLKLTYLENSSETDFIDVNEMMVLASSLDDCQEVECGDIIWAKLTGPAVWRAMVLEECQVGARKGLNKTSGEKSVLVQFFGTYDFARVQDEVILSDSERLRTTQNYVKMLQRHFIADTLPWIQRLQQKEQGLQRRLLRVGTISRSFICLYISCCNMLHICSMQLMRIVESLEGKGCRLPLMKEEVELAEKLAIITRQLKGSGAELVRRVQNLLTLSRLQGDVLYGASLHFPGSTKIHEQSLVEMQEMLQQQTVAIARLGCVLKRDIRDMEIIVAGDTEKSRD
ncbi:hypothetical protein F511_14990 [Dorcoceras hygrometricum]|uniref:PWWP domain-containing protein n=1 Tax=Dorcoceras hygrometricum TaxID=472368 RepID=A0A2Z7BCH1_9LAMI|nr:hypothetical protein F511_14990 [Dorcoceras hygrometricum]